MNTAEEMLAEALDLLRALQTGEAAAQAEFWALQARRFEAIARETQRENPELAREAVLACVRSWDRYRAILYVTERAERGRHAWAHAMCLACWVARFGRTKRPFVVVDETAMACCYCAGPAVHGIIFDEDPNAVACGGQDRPGPVSPASTQSPAGGPGHRVR